MKLPGVISLRNDLPVCAMPNGGCLPRRRHDVEEVDEDALRGLRSQVVKRALVLGRAEVRAQQPVEHPRLGPRAARAAVRAGQRLQVDAVGVGDLLALGELLAQMVLAIALVARLALDQRVDEGVEVAGGLPDVRGEDHRGVEADDVVAGLHHRPPPLPADVLLQLHAKRAVVPGGATAAIDLRRREDDAPALAEADEVVDSTCVAGRGGVGHACAPSGWRSAGRRKPSRDHASVTRGPAYGRRAGRRVSPARTPRIQPVRTPWAR